MAGRRCDMIRAQNELRERDTVWHESVIWRREGGNRWGIASGGGGGGVEPPPCPFLVGIVDAGGKREATSLPAYSQKEITNGAQNFGEANCGWRL